MTTDYTDFHGYGDGRKGTGRVRSVPRSVRGPRANATGASRPHSNLSGSVCLRAIRGLPVLARLALALALGTGSAVSAATSLRVTDLRCEYSTEPTGIDVAQPRLFWRVASEEKDQRQTARQILVASTAELLAQDRGDLWDSGRVSSEETTQLAYAGAPLKSLQRVHWKVRAWDRGGEPTAWSAPASWTMGLLTEAEWKGRWICAPWTSEALLLRTEFAVKPGLKRAVLNISGLGQYEAFLNGTKTDADVLAPGWTNYNETTLYDVREVTALLREGANALGVALGRGMYHVERRNRFAKFVGSFGPLRAIAQLHLEYADGSTAIVGSDESWRVQRGPLTYSSIYGGEDFDARLEPAGWKRAGFDAASWEAAVAVNRPAFTLRGHSRAAEPLREIERRDPVLTRELAAGVVLYDFGQNASFMPAIRVSGPAGSVVKLTPGEVVKADGTIERGTMGGAHRGSAWWQYTKSTDAPESWFPQFYYVGSRYLYAELQPAADGAARPKIDSVQMAIVHGAATPVGSFAAANERFNRIRELVRWAQRSNLVSVLTDCPHREKLGWIEQFHLNGPAIRYEFDVARSFSKSMYDMADAQLDTGLVPNIAPEYTVFKGTFRAAAEWGAAFILVPWQQYVFTGDREILRVHYDAMKRYYAYLESRTSDGLLAEGLGDWYDLEVGKKGRANLTPPPITATAFLFHDARILEKIAAVLGRADDAKLYAEKAAAVRARYNREFWHPETGTYGSGSQASLALPLALGIVDEANRAPVLAALVRDVEARGYATAGDVGFRFLLRALADGGRSDVIARLIDQDEKPGYGYQLKQGATALTESWDANLGASHNHFMLGQVTEWFYHDLAGIQPDESAPGFRHFTIRPQPVANTDWVEARYDSIRGPIVSRWERRDGTLRLRVTIPANTTATVAVPLSSPGAVVRSDAGTPERREADRAVFELPAGSYAFEVGP